MITFATLELEDGSIELGAWCELDWATCWVKCLIAETATWVHSEASWHPRDGDGKWVVRRVAA